MMAFGEYAKYYDLLYADKDYASESAFVGEIIHRHAPEARSLLELGCGSARHALELIRKGFAITGIDLSSQMIARGQAKIAQLPLELRSKIKLMQGDATRFTSATPYDAVISLFHVINYQTTNDALKGIFGTARAALAEDGIFIFDFWYGPAVLSERPQVRVKRIEAAEVCVTRIAEPTLDINRNVVDVNYTLIVADRARGQTEEIKELHSVRYLFLPEIELLAANSGFEIAESGEWLTGNHLHSRCWSGYVAARAIRN
jgi:SAM-dependent methyltransferase